jgi:predicted DCC family thiol-disulfide oxidoreductase YuxK
MSENRRQDTAETTELHELSRRHPVVFFDGVCGLCDQVVDWIVEKDTKDRFRFAPLQGKAARAAFHGFNPMPTTASKAEPPKTVVLLKNDRYFKRSSAIVEILLDLPGWRILGWMLWLIPWPLRDLGYVLVAKVRYSIWGKRDTCRLPTPDERARFLD